jgi:hypothetical protein
VEHSRPVWIILDVPEERLPDDRVKGWFAGANGAFKASKAFVHEVMDVRCIFAYGVTSIAATRLTRWRQNEPAIHLLMHYPDTAKSPQQASHGVGIRAESSG